MPVYALGAEPQFPPPEEAEPGGLLAVGGDLSAERLVEAYSRGIFPWYDEPPILWFSPDPRGVLPMDALHVPRRLERTVRQGRFELRIDSAFGAVIRACAATRRAGQRGTWITGEMIEAYEQLHEMGLAHSAECWRDGLLVGGVYGLSLGSAFFGESMFQHERDASKVALVALHRQLAGWDFSLFDTQLPSEHLASLGGASWPRRRYLAALEHALAHPTRRGRWNRDPGVGRR